MLAAAAPPLAAQPDAAPRTGAETSGFARTTTHDELLAFLFEIQSRTDRMLITRLTTTAEGRMLPLVMLGAPPTATPGTAWLSGKPTLLITGSVHGNEVSGKEGALQLIRELTLGAHRELLDRVNVLIVPSLNPDGAEARRRTNALGYDMNRDFVALETPEISALVEDVLLRWWPDVFVDAHNGGAFPYHLTYQPTLHPAADSLLVAFARGPMYDAVRRHFEAQRMLLYWYSGPRLDERTGTWEWRTTEPWVRKQHSYGGMHNVLTLLFEVPSRHPLETQARAQREGYIALLRFLTGNADATRRTVMAARRRAAEGHATRVPLGTRDTTYPARERFYVVERDTAGRPLEPRLVTGVNRTRYVPTESRARPWAYVLDARLSAIAAHLRRHGIEVERLQDSISTEAERFHLTSIRWAERPYQSHLNATATVALSHARMTFPAGAYLVRTGQSAGLLAAHLLEPDTDDSLLTWNFLDHSIPPVATDSTGLQDRSMLPIYRVMHPVGVRAVLEGGAR